MMMGLTFPSITPLRLIAFVLPCAVYLILVIFNCNCSVSTHLPTVSTTSSPLFPTNAAASVTESRTCSTAQLKLAPFVPPLIALASTFVITFLTAALPRSELPYGLLVQGYIFANISAFSLGFASPTTTPDLTWLITLEVCGYLLLHVLFFLVLCGAGLDQTQMGFVGMPFYLWDYLSTLSWVIGNGLSSAFHGLGSAFASIGNFIRDVFSAILCKTIPKSPSLPAPCTIATPGPIIGDSLFNPSQSLTTINVCPPPPYSVHIDESDDIRLRVEKYWRVLPPV